MALGKDFRIGERVGIHPASPWFQRGVTHGIVTSKRMPPNGEMTVYFVRPDTVGMHLPAKLRMQLPREWLMPLDVR